MIKVISKQWNGSICQNVFFVIEVPSPDKVENQERDSESILTFEISLFMKQYIMIKFLEF